MPGFDSIKLSKETEKIVCQDLKRKYYRFRKAKFYGGICTADCVGCNLRCTYCWARKIVLNPQKSGEFISPEGVVGKLVKCSRRTGYKLMRISGNEPTICKKHLIRVLEILPSKYDFILETNGILIGYDDSFAKELSRFKNLHVRVCLKGVDEESFSKITGAEEKAFGYQLKALENLLKSGCSFHPAITNIFKEEDYLKLKKALDKISEDLYNQLEIEPYVPYGKSKTYTYEV